MRPPGDHHRRLALVLGDLAEHAAQREARAEVAHALDRLEAGERVDRLRGIVHPLDHQEGQVGAQVAGEVGGDDLGRQGLLVLPRAAAEDRLQRGLVPLGKQPGRQLGEVHHRDVAVGRHDHPVAVDLDDEAAAVADRPLADLGVDQDGRVLEVAEDLLRHRAGRRGRGSTPPEWRRPRRGSGCPTLKAFTATLRRRRRGDRAGCGRGRRHQVRGRDGRGDRGPGRAALGSRRHRAARGRFRRGGPPWPPPPIRRARITPTSTTTRPLTPSERIKQDAIVRGGGAAVDPDRAAGARPAAGTRRWAEPSARPAAMGGGAARAGRRLGADLVDGPALRAANPGDLRIVRDRTLGLT